MVVDRRPLLILVSSASLLSILAPARDVSGLPTRIGDMVANRLRREGIAPKLIAGELDAMSSVVVASTADRSIVGFMAEFALTVPHHLEGGTWDEMNLARIPCHASRRQSAVIWPDRKARELLAARWGKD